MIFVVRRFAGSSLSFLVFTTIPGTAGYRYVLLFVRFFCCVLSVTSPPGKHNIYFFDLFRFVCLLRFFYHQISASACQDVYVVPAVPTVVIVRWHGIALSTLLAALYQCTYCIYLRRLVATEFHLSRIKESARTLGVLCWMLTGRKNGLMYHTSYEIPPSHTAPSSPIPGAGTCGMLLIQVLGSQRSSVSMYSLSLDLGLSTFAINRLVCTNNSYLARPAFLTWKSRI